MANVCTTEVEVSSTIKVIDWLEEKLKKMSELNDDEFNLNFIDTFGKKGESITDKVGAKWLVIEKYRIERIEEEILKFVLETANHPPSDLLVNMQKMINEKEIELEETEYAYNSTINGRFWDEAFQPIGVFTTSPLEWVTDEAYLDDIDFDDENYWDNQVEPAFDNLEV